MARRVEVELIGDSSSLERAFGRAQKSGGKLSKAFSTGLKAAAGVGVVALGGLTVAAKIGFDEFQAGQKVMAQTNAVIKSTGGIANVTAKHVDDLAVSLMKKSGVDDEVIASGENVLLTFKNVRNELGKGNQIFDQATTAALDMSVALGTDLQSNVMAVGKALNDPITGVAKLTRVGVTFTDKQKNLIESLVESGDVMGAQKVILKELRSEFGGSAAAAGDTFAGKINILRESFNNWAGDMVSNVMPTLENFIDRISKAEGFKAKFKVAFVGIKSAAQDVWDEFSDLITGTSQMKPLKLKSGKILEWEAPAAGLADQIQQGIKDVDWAKVGKTIGENVSSKIQVTTEWLNTALEKATAWVDSNSGKIAEVGAKIALQVVSTLLDPVFWAKNWDLILLLIASRFPGGKLLAKLGGRLGGALMRPFFETVGKQLGRLPGVFQRGLSAAAAAVARFAQGAWNIISTQFGKIPSLLRRAFRVTAILAAFEAVKNAVGTAVDFIRRQLNRIPGFTTAVTNSFLAVKAAVNLVVGAIQTLIDWIGRIPSPSSWIPERGGGVPFIPGIASGGDIARGGLAMVHQGERVMPAKVVNRGGNGSSSGGGLRYVVLANQEVVNMLRDLDSQERRRSGGRGIL